MLLGFTGVGHLSGWQWLFLIEGLPSILLGVGLLGYLTERPAEARWLSARQRAWLIEELEQERLQTPSVASSLRQAFASPLVWILAGVYFAEYTVALGYVSWAPTLVRDALATGDAATGEIVGAIALLAVLVYLLAA